MKFGIEFEMIIFYNDEEEYTLWKKKLLKFGRFTTDGSITLDTKDNIESFLLNKFRYFYAIEFVTKPFTNLKELLDLINNVFIKKDIIINPSNINEITEDITKVILFNKSTGTHIHCSTSMLDKKTKELILISKNKPIIDKMVKKIHDDCKFRFLEKHFNRKYTDSLNITDRSREINVSDYHSHGTIEFRLFHLRGVTKDNLLAVLKHYFELINSSLDLCYKELLLSDNKKEVIDSTIDIFKKLSIQKKKLDKQYKFYKNIFEEKGYDKEIKKMHNSLNKYFNQSLKSILEE